MRGDFIETFKILRGLVNYGQNLFRVSRSGLNLVSRGNKVSRSRQDFLSERVINYWNNLPKSYMTCCQSSLTSLTIRYLA